VSTRDQRREAYLQEKRLLGLRPWHFAPSDTRGCRNPCEPGTDAWEQWESVAAIQREIDRRRRAANRKPKPENSK
jgi:hypothetical protein